MTLENRHGARVERMKQVRDALKVPNVLVQPRDEKIRKHVAHMPGKIAFPKEGPARWPLDTFTRRRIADGDVTVVEEEVEASAPAAPAPAPAAPITPTPAPAPEPVPLSVSAPEVAPWVAPQA